MAGLTQRTTEATRRAAAADSATAPIGNNMVTIKEEEDINSRSPTPPMSNSSSSTNLNLVMLNGAPAAAANGSKGKSLAERSEIPYSFMITFGTVLGLQYFSGMWQWATLDSWYASLKTSSVTTVALLDYARSLAATGWNEGLVVVRNTKIPATAAAPPSWIEYVSTFTICALCASLFYVFFVAPFAAGMWTGRKARRHKFHRYMGLAYLIHYVLAWVEFFTNYGAAKNSYLCHIVAVIGMFIFLFGRTSLERFNCLVAVSY